ncbi:MAG: ABC transporter permease [Actinomycetota bacterium]
MRAAAILRRPQVSLRMAWRLWARNAFIYRRTYKLNILPNFFEPLLYLMAMGFGLGAYLSRVNGVRYIDFIAPGLVAVSAMYGASFEVTWNCFFKMAERNVYDGCIATPLTIEDVALGEILWGATRALIYGVTFLATASLFGVVHSWWALAAPMAIGLVGLMFSVIGLTYTAVIQNMDFFAYYWTLFITPMFLFSGIFFPLDRLPGWVQSVAWFVPLHQAARLMRALILQGDPWTALRAGLWLAIFTAALFLLPLNLLHRRMMQ